MFANVSRSIGAALVLCSFLTIEANGQLVWNQKMDKYSAILPLTLEDDVYRVRAKPPEGVAPRDINCEIGITGTVLTDKRGTSAGDPGEKVANGLRTYDNLDVQFSDRVFSGYHTQEGDRIIQKYDFDCGINIKYQNKIKVAQVEIRLGYVLPSGDIEGLTWQKLIRKQKLMGQNINRCEQCRRDIDDLNSQRSSLLSINPDNAVQRTLINVKLSGIAKKIDVKSRYADRKDEFERDRRAFASLEEYLKTKVNGCQVYVHFDYQGKTLSVDVEELKRARIRPIQVFEEGKDPVKNRAESVAGG